MKSGSGLDVLAMDMRTAVLTLAERGLPVRIEPTPAPKASLSVARWRVARQSATGDRCPVLVVVPEIEGRIACANRTPNQ